MSAQDYSADSDFQILSLLTDSPKGSPLSHALLSV